MQHFIIFLTETDSNLLTLFISLKFKVHILLGAEEVRLEPQVINLMKNVKNCTIANTMNGILVSTSL